jgi:uncharacterized protein YtpQ (UPF0354 family)
MMATVSGPDWGRLGGLVTSALLTSAEIAVMLGGMKGFFRRIWARLRGITVIAPTAVPQREPTANRSSTEAEARNAKIETPPDAFPLPAARAEVAGSAPLSRADFTREFVEVLKRQAPGMAVRVMGELELRVATGDGEGSQVFLYNAYDAYQQDPARVEAVFTNYALALAQLGAVRDDPVDPERIVPVIKDRTWMSETLARVRAHPKYQPGQEQVFEPYNDELLIFYAEDLPRGIRYLTEEGVQKWGLQRESLRPLAVRNLRALLPEVQVLGSGGLYLITAGGNYEASLLLFEPFWRERKLEVQGDYVVAIPARDTLLVTGSDDFEGMRRVREAVAQVYPQAPYRLTESLFVRRGEKFELLAE